MITALGERLIPDHIDNILGFVILVNLKHLTQKNYWDQPRMCPCSIKTWEVLGNPSRCRCCAGKKLEILNVTPPIETFS